MDGQLYALQRYSGSRLLGYIIGLLIIFSGLGGFLSGASNALVLVIFSFLGILSAFTVLGAYTQRLTICVALYVLSLITLSFFGVINGNEMNVIYLIKILLPPVIATAIFYSRKGLQPRLFYFICAFSIVIIFFWTLTQPLYFHESEFWEGVESRRGRLYPFFENSPHSSSYLVGGFLALFWSAHVAEGYKPRFFFFGILLMGAFLIVGYRSTQALLSVMIFFGISIILLGRLSRRQIWLFSFFGMLLLIGVVVDKFILEYNLKGQYVDIRSIGSGRFGTWIGRLINFSERDVIAMFIGAGAGSDTVVGDVWWYAAPAHNVMLTFLMEYGVLGLVVFLGYVASFASVGGRRVWPLVFVIAASGVIGNGISLRPTIFIVFATATAMLARRLDIRNDNEGVGFDAR